MATTQIAFTDAQLDAELARNRKDLEKLQERLRGEQRTADAAKSELSRVVDAIERGVTGKEVEHSRAKDALELANIRVKGIEKLVAPVEQRLRELTEELGRRQREAARVAREKELGDRTEKLKVRLLKIRETLALLCTGELFMAEQERAIIASEFGDIGGMEIAKALSEILFKPSRPSEATRTAEVHLAQLEAAGLVPFGFEIVTGFRPSPVQGQPSALTSALRPGRPLCFTILPMGPRAS
jgi:chromosome segregation ATPase